MKKKSKKDNKSNVKPITDRKEILELLKRKNYLIIKSNDKPPDNKIESYESL